MDAVDHGKHLLAAILPVNGDGGRKELLELALRQVSPEHFADPQQRLLFQMMEWYLENTGTVLPLAAIGDYLRSFPPGTAMQYEEYYRSVQLLGTSPEKFGYHAEQLRELAAERLTAEAFAQGMEILRHGAQDGQDWLKGHAAAREHVLSSLSEVERTLHLQVAPEGDVRAEAMDVMAEYGRRHEQRKLGHAVIRTGLAELDEALGGGMQRGELVLVAGGTNVGKTSLAVDWIWRACVQQGKNVVVFTSETNRLQVRTKIIARHSRHLYAGDSRLPEGLNTKDLRGGNLPDDKTEFLRYTVNHFAESPSHGRCWVAQVPRGATIATLDARLSRISRMFPADLVVVDYLMLLRSDRKRQSRREELSEIVIAAKEMATGYMDGRGVPLVSPWQMNREGVKNAGTTRDRFTTEDLAETAEASCTADIILGLLPDGIEEAGKHGRETPVKIGTVKVRDGERLRDQMRLIVDYATCYFQPRQSGGDALAMDFGGPPA